MKKLENTPGYVSAVQEREKADKEYREADSQFSEVNSDIKLCKKCIEENNYKYDGSKLQIENAEKEFNNAILQRLELRKEMVELYDKLRIKSENARVMTPKNVENVRGEKDNAIRILENEQRKYWHIIGQSDEKYGIGYIPLFREQYRDIANVKIEEAKHKLEEQQHVLENAFMVDFVAEMNEAVRMLFFNLCKKLESYMNSMDVYRAMNQNDEEM